MERVPPQGAPGACGGPCFCVDFAFLAWPCTGSPKVPSGVDVRAWMHYIRLLCILQCTAGLSGTMTSWNVLNSAVCTYSEPATSRVTLLNVQLVWRNCCLQSCQPLAFFCCPNWSHCFIWLHVICTTEDIFACLSSVRALPMAEEYYWRSSLILQVYISPL